MPRLADDPARDEQLARLRRAYPLFRVADTRAADDGTTLRLTFQLTAGDVRFTPALDITGLRPQEMARAVTSTARRLIRALSIVEAFSYWKAFCSPVIAVATPAAPGEAPWWDEFWRPAMGEFFYRNGISGAYATPPFLAITAPEGTVPEGTAPEGAAEPGQRPAPASGPPLVMFSGGKDSLALTYAISDGPTDMFLYNPTVAQAGLAESLSDGGRIICARRRILPELLALNDAGHPNGHTPYSAYLAFAALLAGYLRGSSIVTAGNSRSDDEPNVSDYQGTPINHQWTKSHEYEAALGRYRDRWAPDAPPYSSPLRPLYELQIIRTLSSHLDEYLRTASCNRTKGEGWCRQCAKCAWVYLATAVLFGHHTATSKAGGDMFADASLAPLYLAMAGLDGDKPFECTGTEDEVRSAIAAAGAGGRDHPALAPALRDAAIAGARPLDVLLKDWGQDDLMLAPLRDRVRRAASL